MGTKDPLRRRLLFREKLRVDTAEADYLAFVKIACIRL